MQQLKHALQAAGYRSTPEIKAERDRAIAALVKARKHKRKGAKALKAKVLAFVAALKIPAPIGALAAFLVAFVAAPGLALAHPGHDGHGPDMNAGGAVVLVGLTLGLAGYAWAQWGDRRRALVSADSGVPMAGGPSPEPSPEPSAEYRCPVCGEQYPRDPSHCDTCGHEHGDVIPVWELTNDERAVWATLSNDQREWANANLKPYYTVRIPYTAHGATEWHPTEDTGPFRVLTRGAFATLIEARAWADAKLGGTSYSVALITNRLGETGDRSTIVYTR